VKGTGKVYICIFDGPGLPRGERSTIDNKRITGTTDYDNGTDAFTMETSKAHKTKLHIIFGAWALRTPLTAFA
jgi:hypothetical protein